MSTPQTEQAIQEISQQQSQEAPEPRSSPQLYDVKVRGESQKVPLEKLIESYSKGEDYTHKTTALANERREWEARLAEGSRATQEAKAYRQQIEQVKKFFADPRVKRAVSGLYQQQPTQPVTARDFNDYATQLQEHVKRVVSETVQRETLKSRLGSMSEQIEQRLRSTIKEALKEHEVLNDIDGVDELLLGDVRGLWKKQEIRTTDEALQAIRNSAKARAERLTSRFQPSKPPVRNEAPGGMTPASVSPERTATSVRDRALRNSVIQELQNLSAS